MRITINTSSTETLEYLRTIVMITRNNKNVEDEVKAYHALKELVKAMDDRLTKIETDIRRR